MTDVATLAYTKTMHGMAIIAKITHGDASFLVTALENFPLPSQAQEAMAYALFYNINDRVAVTPEDLVEGTKFFKIYQGILRAQMHEIFEQRKSAKEIEIGNDLTEARRQNRAQLDHLAKQMKAAHQPDDMGTVAEIAERYGISKSEVRRRKQEGTLHELTKG